MRITYVHCIETSEMTHTLKFNLACFDTSFLAFALSYGAHS